MGVPVELELADQQGGVPALQHGNLIEIKAGVLGVDGPVVSPTFTLVREYEGRVRLCHVDVYRLERVQEIHELGIEEQLEESVTLIEWGEVAASALPPDRLEVRITAGAGPDHPFLASVPESR